MFFLRWINKGLRTWLKIRKYHFFCSAKKNRFFTILFANISFGLGLLRKTRLISHLLWVWERFLFRSSNVSSAIWFVRSQENYYRPFTVFFHIHKILTPILIQVASPATPFRVHTMWSECSIRIFHFRYLDWTFIIVENENLNKLFLRFLSWNETAICKN